MCEDEQYEQILDTVAAPVWTLDEDGCFGYVNDAFERLTRYDAEEIRGEPLTRILSSDDAQATLAALSNLRADADSASDSVEATLSPRDGDERPLECHLALFEGGDAVVVAHDVSEHRAREQRLSKFASVVSHDLRNPLDVALGRAEVLPEIADVDAETETHLNEIYSSLKRMEHLIEEVLTLSRQEHGTVDVECVDLAAVAVDAWRTVETQDATLTVTAEVEVYAHRSRLLRLFENLFRNAVEHGGPGVTVEVDLLESSRENGTGGFYVADNGSGIDESDRERLFEGGYSSAAGGTGLGLTIVREIARGHGWSVEVTDSTTGGARFEVTGVTIPD